MLGNVGDAYGYNLLRQKKAEFQSKDPTAKKKPWTYQKIGKSMYICMSQVFFKNVSWCF